MELQVVLLTSTKTQIPFDYYSAPYCRASRTTKEAENLGEVRFQPFPFFFFCRTDVWAHAGRLMCLRAQCQCSMIVAHSTRIAL